LSNMNLVQRREHLLDTVCDQDPRTNISEEILKNIEDKERKDEIHETYSYRRAGACLRCE